MESDSDPRLKHLLQEWQVPNAPDTLEARVFGQGRSWWRVLMSARVGVPVPVAVAFAVALLWLAVVVVRDRTPAMEPLGTPYDLRGFQPVDSVSVRIERTNDATR